MLLSFDILRDAWNKVRTDHAADLQSEIPGLINPQAILIQRTGETPDGFTVLFRGFDQALDDIRNAPLLKRVILKWIQTFAIAQIERGDDQSFIIRLSTDMKGGPDTAPAGPAPIPESTPNKDLVTITRISEDYDPISKDLADYRGHPVNGEECADCTMFRGPASCTLVTGKIYAHGHCQYFRRR